MAGTMQSNTSKGSGGREPFLAFVSDAQDIETLKQFARMQQWSESCIYQGNILTAAEFLGSRPPPAVLLVEIPSAAEAPGMLDKLADVCDPGTKVIVCGTINEYSFYCWLTEIGILYYILHPITLPALEVMLEKTKDPAPGQKAAVAKEPASTFAVMGTRGGVGATTLALNLATIFADHHGKHTALVDLDPQLGTVALELDMEAARGLRDVLEKPDRIDGLFLERVMLTHHKNLSVLGAEESMLEKISFHDQAADALLKEVRAKFEVVVLDVPRLLNNYTRFALKHATEVLLVTDLSLAGLRDGLRIVDFFRDALKVKPPLFVANRVGMAGKHEVPVSDYEKGVHGKLLNKIPYAPDIFMSPSPEVAVNISRASPAAKAIYQIAEHLLPLESKGEKVEAKPMGKLTGLLAKKK